MPLPRELKNSGYHDDYKHNAPMALRLHNGFVVKLQLLRHTRSGALDAGYNRSRLHMKDTIRTREFSIDDYEAAVELWKRVEGLEIAEGDDRHSVEEFLARNPELNRVAMDGELIVGVSLCGHDGRRGHIYHLAVDPAYQGLGLGKRLVEECFDGLRRAGIQRAIILVAKDNPRGREFWLRSGWEELPEAMAMGKDVATTAPS